VADPHRADGLGVVELVVQLGVLHAGDAEGAAGAQLLEGMARQPGAGPIHRVIEWVID
jgi:hypothetical protein